MQRRSTCRVKMLICKEQLLIMHLQSASTKFSEPRSNFKTLICMLKQLYCYVSQKCGVKPAFEEKRQSMQAQLHKRHFDEIAEDSRLTDAEDCFWVNVLILRYA